MEANDTQDEPEEEAKVVKSEQSEDEDPEPEGPPEAGAEMDDKVPLVESSSSKQLKAKEDQSDESDKDEEMKSDDDDNKDFDEEDLENLLQNSAKEEFSDNDSLGRGTPLLGFDVPSSEAGNKDTNYQSTEEFLSEKIPSESENSDTGVEDSVAEDSLPAEVKQEAEQEEVSKAVKSELSDDDSQEPKTLEAPPATTEIEAEDVYEFKEPEPFEFEARKSEDKGKGTKRTLCSISVEDKPSSPKYKKMSVSPTRDGSSKGSYQSPSDLLSKDDNSPESTPTIQTCEEAFDKICASPLRAATLDSRGTALLDNMDNYEDDDHFDDDSEDRLVISERDSDNGSNISLETSAHELGRATAEPDSQPEPMDKEKFKDKYEDEVEDDEDVDDTEAAEDEYEDGDDEEEVDEEEIESEALKSTEQADSSDDLSEEEPQQITSDEVPASDVQHFQADDNDASSKPPENEKPNAVDVESKVEDAEKEVEAAEKKMEVDPDVANEPDDVSVNFLYSSVM